MSKKNSIILIVTAVVIVLGLTGFFLFYDVRCDVESKTTNKPLTDQERLDQYREAYKEQTKEFEEYRRKSALLKKENKKKQKDNSSDTVFEQIAEELLPIVQKIEKIADKDPAFPSYLHNSIHTEWMAEIEELFGDELSDLEKHAIRESHIKLLRSKDILNDVYLRAEITWEEFNEALKQLVRQHEAIYNEILNNEQYERLTGHSRDEIDEVIDAVLTPPTDSEMMTLFPRLQSEYPEIKTDEDVYQIIPKEKMDLAMEALIERIAANQAHIKRVNAGEFDDMDEVLKISAEINEAYIERLKEFLSDEEIQLLVGDYK